MLRALLSYCIEAACVAVIGGALGLGFALAF